MAADRDRPRLVVVTHSHLDREWYRTAEGFRARLVDALDGVLDLFAADADFAYTLDGQTVPLEDYLHARPHRRSELEAVVKNGRLTIGPWYVQPDGFIPAAESIVRNLLEGRAVGAEFGGVSRVGYLPDTFGHPAQLPMILRGFDLDAFCFRRGMGDDADDLPSEFVWQAPDGTSILTLYLAKGYGNAAFLPDDPDDAARRMAGLAESLLEVSTGRSVLLMNGCDHTLPADMELAVERLADLTGAQVVRGHVDDIVAEFAERIDELPVHLGELRGARRDALLHGVLSSRVDLKRANAAAEDLLYGWAEPFAALAAALGARDERPLLRSARRELLHNHAHDSLCCTSLDPVHREMQVRFSRVTERARTTAERALSLLATGQPSRSGRWDGGVDLAVFNPNPFPVSGLVEHWFDADPPYAVDDGRLSSPPLLLATNAAEGLAVDGRPARLLQRPNERQFLWETSSDDRGVQFPVEDVPALGWRRVRLTAAPRQDDIVDDGREIAVGDLRVAVDDRGTLSMEAAGRRWEGLLGLSDVGDRGDSYDFSPVEPVVRDATLRSLERRRHPSGVQQLTVRRQMVLPSGLDDADRGRRATDTVVVDVAMTVTVAPGLDGVDVSVTVDNTARDHRLRLDLPLAAAADGSVTEGPFHVVARGIERRDKGRWIQPPPTTFPVHGFVTVPDSGLAVVAPGLYEGEVTDDGVLHMTVLRAVGWLAHDTLPERGRVGPAIRTPDGQCLRTMIAHLRLLPYDDVETLPSRARAARLGLSAVEAGPTGLLAEGRALLTVGPAPLTLSAVKPAEDGDGFVVRVWNPGEKEIDADVVVGATVRGCRSVRLDEEPDGGAVRRDGSRLTFTVPPRATRSVLVEAQA